MLAYFFFALMNAQPTQPPSGELVIHGRRYPLEGAKVVNYLDAREWDIRRAVRSRKVVADRPGKPRKLAQLQEVVRVVVLHRDLTNDAKRTFEVLAARKLSSHLIVDWDGTIYQLADLAAETFHAGKPHNEYSIGVDINGRGINQLFTKEDPADEPKWRAATERRTKRYEAIIAERGSQRPMSEVKRINGMRMRTHGFTEPQYAALTVLLRRLLELFPKVRPEIPRGDDGRVIPRMLLGPEKRFLKRGGIVAHWHLKEDRRDPGPGFDWERVMSTLSR